MKKIILFLVLFIVVFNTSNAQFCLSPVVITGISQSAASPVSADFNGDGRIDIATIGADSKVLISFGDGGGGFYNGIKFPVEPYPKKLVSADFNKDGKMDLATVNSGGINFYVSVLLNDGLGNFSSAVNYVVTVQEQNDIICADFNKDGNIDIATCSNYSNYISILLGNGLGGFSAATNFPVNKPLSIASGDINGDGKMDIVTSNYSQKISWLLGNGTGGFSVPTYLDIPNLSPTSIITADFNKDGKIDIATGSSSEPTISVFLNNGSGNFSQGWASGSNSNAFPLNIITTDINGDGNLDIISANRNTNLASAYQSAWIFLGNSVGKFTYNSYIQLNIDILQGANYGPQGITYADFNADGKMDFVTSNWDSTLSSILGQLTFNISQIKTDCIGTTNATATVSCGIPPYSYSWNTIPVQTGATATGLLPGSNYVLTVTDKTSSKALGIKIGEAFTITINKTNVSCIGLTDGAATATATGGTPPYTYSWNTIPVHTTATANNLTTGNYTVTVTDSKGCIKTSVVTVGFKPDIAITPAVTDVSCFGGKTGSVVTAVIGGTPPYTYLWNSTPSQSTANIYSLGVGNYALTVTDSKGCTKVQSVTVNQPTAALVVSVNKTDVTCNGLANGTAIATVSAGTAPYTYSWNTSPVKTTATVNNLSSGFYKVTVKDSKNCIQTADVSITQPVLLSLSTTKTDVSCIGGNDGTLTAMPTGGTLPYSYSWNTIPVQTTATANNLKTGNYTATITDSKGCTKSVTETVVNRPFSNYDVTTVASPSNWCNSKCNGTASVSITGGNTEPYTYQWDATANNQLTQTATELCPGTYIVTVKDSKGCSKLKNVTVNQQSIVTTISSNNPNTNCSPCNGSARVIPNGGTEPYNYKWDATTNNQTTQTATGLCASSYKLTITDSAGCTKIQDVTITNIVPPVVNATISSVPNNKCSGICNGTATVIASGGTMPYNYIWGSSTNNQTSSIATNLCQGTHDVTVRDSKGCIVLKSVNVGVLTNANSNIYLTNLAAVDQVSVSPAFTAYYTYNLPAKINPNASNLRNFVDPGKKARFKVECTNKKANGQSIVSGICEVRSNSPYITITDNSSALNNIGWNNKAWSADEFEIDIKPETPAGTIAYIDFIVKENGIEYITSCIPLPITPLNYSLTTEFTIDDDTNPDSAGNDNNICEPNEIIEFYPWLNNVSTLNAEYVRGRFENLDNLSYINIWNNKPGVNTTVFDTTWWNFSFGQPAVINSNSINTTPEYDFVFNYNNPNKVNNFKLYMVMAGGFKLFSGNALSLVQWSLPFTFNEGALSTSDFLKDNSLDIYPNPGTTNIKINNSDALLGSFYSIIDISGRVVATGILATANGIDVSKLSKGLYIIRIGNNFKSKFIKE